MANMSHCRFQNTLQDLRDCMDALSGMDCDPLAGLSKAEADAARRMFKLCAEIAADYDAEQDSPKGAI